MSWKKITESRANDLKEEIKETVLVLLDSSPDEFKDAIDAEEKGCSTDTFDNCWDMYVAMIVDEEELIGDCDDDYYDDDDNDYEKLKDWFDDYIRAESKKL